MMRENNRVEIRYCNGCRWLPRAAWMAQELLTTFESELHEVALQPGQTGEFSVWLNGSRMWDRKENGGFPELKLLKQSIRDVVALDRDLGHSDVSA